MFRTTEALASKHNREEREWPCHCALNVAQKDHEPYTFGRHDGPDILFESPSFHYPVATAGPQIDDSTPPGYQFWLTPQATPPLTVSSAGDYDFSSIMDGLLMPDEMLAINEGQEPTDPCQAANTTVAPPSSSSPALTWSTASRQKTPEPRAPPRSRPQSRPPCRNGPDKTCMALCLDALVSLRAPSQGDFCVFSKSPKQVPPSRRARKLDAALATNRGGICDVSRVLECPCAAIPAVQLAVVSVCDRIIAWNEAILHAEEDEEMVASSSSSSSSSSTVPVPAPAPPDTTSRSRSRSSTTSTTSSNITSGGGVGVSGEAARSERVSRQAIRIGSFSVQGDLAERFCAHIADDGLHRLDEVVQRLAKLPAVQGDAASGAARPLTEAVQRDLVALLRRRIQGAKGAAGGRIQAESRCCV